MVSLSTAYGLCSLIDQTGLLHVSEDENDYALVTLGRNIVMRYRLSDQKQLNNWSTIPQLTSKVVYDKVKNCYFGIFTENVIKQWNTDNIDLEKVSKFKLKESAHEILIDDEPVVLFKTGACCLIDCFRDKSFEIGKGFLPDDAKIQSARIVTLNGEKYLIILGVIAKNQTMCYSVRLSSDYKPIPSTLKNLKLRRKNHQLLGSCFIFRDNGENLITLWSDRFLYMLPLPILSEQYDLPIGQFKGVLRSINASLPVAMTNLSPHHLAIYGGDPGEEGAVLAVYNLEFGMVQASTSFKLLQKPPRVWAVHGRLLVGLGQRLICVPYTLETDSMAALVGTRPPQSDAQQNDVVPVMPTVAWEETPQQNKTTRSTDNEIQSEIESLSSQGCSESRICEALITQLIEKTDVEKLIWCLEEFVDIPETLIVRLLNFVFTVKDEKFAEPEPLVNGGRAKKRKSKKPVTADDGNPITPAGRANFLNQILRVPHNPEALVPALRTGLALSECLTLLQYFAYVLSSDSSRLEHTIIDWAITAVDAFYQQLVLGRYANCMKSVADLQEKVEEKIQTLNECYDLLPLVLRLRNKEATLKNTMQSKLYSIQKIQLYK